MKMNDKCAHSSWLRIVVVAVGLSVSVDVASIARAGDDAEKIVLAQPDGLIRPLRMSPKGIIIPPAGDAAATIDELAAFITREKPKSITLLCADGNVTIDTIIKVRLMLDQACTQVDHGPMAVYVEYALHSVAFVVGGRVAMWETATELHVRLPKRLD